MNNFIMCNSFDCKEFNSCYRAQKPPEQMQEYFIQENTGQENCPFFICIDRYSPVWEPDDIVAQQQGEGYGHFAPFKYGCNRECWEED